MFLRGCQGQNGAPRRGVLAADGPPRNSFKAYIYAGFGSVCPFSFLYWRSRQDAIQPIIMRGRTTINADIMIICMTYLFLVRRLPHSL